jgi:hypothetical protein
MTLACAPDLSFETWKSRSSGHASALCLNSLLSEVEGPASAFRQQESVEGAGPLQIITFLWRIIKMYEQYLQIRIDTDH